MVLKKDNNLKGFAVNSGENGGRVKQQDMLGSLSQGMTKQEHTINSQQQCQFQLSLCDAHY